MPHPFRLLLALATLGPVGAIDVDDPVAALRHDEIRYNAVEAWGTLTYGWARDQFTEQLRQALRSDDWQQRQLAAHILHRRDVAADPILVAVTVEGLRDDASFMPPDRPNLMLANAKSGTAYLLRHPEAIREELYAALGSDDSQQRFLSAVILGHLGSGDAARRICAILIPHLADNRLPGDGVYAALGIYGLRQDALPWIERVRARSRDPQQRTVLTAIERRILGTHTTTKIPELSTWQRDPLSTRWLRNMRWRDFATHAPAPLQWNHRP